MQPIYKEKLIHCKMELSFRDLQQNIQNIELIRRSMSSMSYMKN